MEPPIALKSLHVFDTFQPPGFIGVGDKYDKRNLGASSGDKDKGKGGGKQILTSPAKKGRLDSVLFEKSYKPLYSNGEFVEMYKVQQKYDNEKSQGLKYPFKPTQPAQKAEGKGSMYGLIGKLPEHQADTPREKTKGDGQVGKRNFLTNPGKKGTYGYSHLGIGGKEFEYIEDPAGKKLNTHAYDHQFKHPHAFIGTDHGDKVFDKTVYDESGVKFKNKKTEKKLTPLHGPFKPSSPVKDYINKFPEYMEQKEKRKTKDDIPPPEKVFKPSGTNDLSVPQASIITLQIPAERTFERSLKL